MKETTHATAIAALEAERNERMTIAAGALAGERRAAWARLAMVLMFAFTMEVWPKLAGGPSIRFDGARVAIGVAYTLWAVGMVLGLRRAVPVPRRVLIFPMLSTGVDFAFVSFQAAMDIHLGAGMNAAMYAVAASILISFSISRATYWHILLAVALAIGCFIVLALVDGSVTGQLGVFVIAGFVGLGIMMALTNRALRGHFRELRRRDNLTRFLPQQVAERMLSIGPEALAPVQREVTVLFSDIRGFTALSESLAPRAVLELLDEYFGRMATVVKGHDGVVGKFIGDGLLAFWNVPDRDPDHAAKAVKAALDMQRSLAELNRARENEGAPPIRIGIGIHTGPVAAGMLGGPEQSEYTVIGDAVNVASRIEGLTKSLGAEILISDSTWSACGDRFDGKQLAAEEIRGRKEPVVLYAISHAAS